MKILFVTRSTIFTIPGGDTTQMRNTAKELGKYQIEVEIYDGSTSINYSQFDFLHFFNITRPSIILDQIKKSKLPYVLSPIYVEYDFYKNLPGFSLMKILAKLFGVDGIEYFKITAKYLLRKEKVEFLSYFFLGQKRAIKKVLKNATLLLPNSQSEYDRLLNRYKISLPYEIVPNGVDTTKFGLNLSIKRKEKSVICAALIEPRKNQLNLIKALNNTDFTLTLVGNPAPNHLNYLEECKRVAGANVRIIDSRVPQEELMVLFQESEIHILPSWFETTGLSSLEAAYMECKIVVTKNGDTEEYFSNGVEYCEPGSLVSIKDSIERAHKKPYSNKLKIEIEKKYNWTYAAKCTAKAYERMRNG